MHLYIQFSASLLQTHPSTVWISHAGVRLKNMYFLLLFQFEQNAPTYSFVINFTYKLICHQNNRDRQIPSPFLLTFRLTGMDLPVFVWKLILLQYKTRELKVVK